MTTKPEKVTGYYFRPSTGEKKRPNNPYLLFRYSAAGMYFGIPIFLGLTIGLFLDTLFHVRPVSTLVFLFFGIIGSFYNIFKIITENGSKHSSH